MKQLAFAVLLIPTMATALEMPRKYYSDYEEARYCSNRELRQYALSTAAPAENIAIASFWKCFDYWQPLIEWTVRLEGIDPSSPQGKKSFEGMRALYLLQVIEAGVPRVPEIRAERDKTDALPFWPAPSKPSP